jgi:pimeloyl-ACP methyl ester carboxylesterase
MRPETTISLRIAIIAFVVCAAPASAAAASRGVDIGGYKLNLRCHGEGAPVVVLDAGAGDTLETWDWVAPDVRRFTRVCAYDRAGLGRSDPGPLPRTSATLVDELHLLLSRAHVSPPYVLVGHSFGGLNVRLFASRHPDEVAGLVLVDGTPEDYPGIAAVLRSRDEREKLTTSLGMASTAYRSELESMTTSANLVRTSQAPDVPVIVLTAARGDGTPILRALWIELQKRMAGTFANVRQVVAEQSGHYIQFDQPELVTSAIRAVVDEARAAHPLPAPRTAARVNVGRRGPSRDRLGSSD